MRGGWVFVVLPMALACYFIFYPEKLAAVLHWTAKLLR